MGNVLGSVSLGDTFEGMKNYILVFTLLLLHTGAF